MLPLSPDAIAILWLSLLVLGAAALIWRQAATSADCWQQWLLHAIARLYTGLMFRLRIAQHCPLPVQGGALVISNHRSPVDPMLVYSVSARRRQGYRIRVIEYLTASEFVSLGGPIGWICKHMKAIPVNRDGRDMDSARESLRRLRDGSIVGVFPEGRLNTQPGEELLPGSAGAGWLALKADAPVIPAFIHGSPRKNDLISPFTTPARVRVVFGEPLDLSEFQGRRVSRELLEQVSERMMRALADLGGVPTARGLAVPINQMASRGEDQGARATA